MTIDKSGKNLDILGVQTKENDQVVTGNTRGKRLALATINDEVDIASEHALQKNPNKVNVIVEPQLDVETGQSMLGFKIMQRISESWLMNR